MMLVSIWLRERRLPWVVVVVVVEVWRWKGLVFGGGVVGAFGCIDGLRATAVDSDERIDLSSDAVTSSYAEHLENRHDMLLDLLFERDSYEKLYSYKHLLNGFAVHVSPDQLAEVLRRAPGVKSVEHDWKVRRLTTHTPQFLGLPTEVWSTRGGHNKAGIDVVIGFVDSGIYPPHPSFATYDEEPYGHVARYKGKCEVDLDTKRSFCNGKIVGAQHFARAAIAAGAFNPAVDFASPLDGDGHGSLGTLFIAIHTASTAAGNNGIPVRLHGYEFGKASGMAPRARHFTVFLEAVQDGVDIINLSVGPNSPPAETKATFLNYFDASLLSAVKAGVFVAQAAGNGGPFPKTMLSYSPWITSVAAAVDDRKYKNHLVLGNGKILPGIGLSPKLED
ncbi:Subtilisin-like protease SBT2.6-like protein [Drosera capensis]